MSQWIHKKYKKRTYRGNYKTETYRGTCKRDFSEERFFELKCNELTHRITFESWQMAKAVGWLKIK